MRLVIPFTLLSTLGVLAAEKRVEFNRDVRPILASKCYACHGPDEEKREADLRLDVRAEAVKEAIKPGKPDDSEFWHRITTTERDDVMPPPSSPKQLTKAERDLFRRWIKEGAEYQDHWSFVPIQRPVVPPSPEQEPHRCLHRRETASSWTQARSGGRSHHADPPRLSRSHGLPPTTSDLSDLSDWSDDKYAALVDRLLASPNFGERWARHWLDMARYADSTASSATACARMPGAIATGSSTPSTATCRLTSSPSSRSPVICCRAHARTTHRQRLPSQCRAEHRGGRGQGGGAFSKPRRPREHHRPRVDGPHRRLRAVPHAQIRPHHHPRLLQLLRLLQQHRRPRRAEDQSPGAGRGDEGSPPDLCPHGG
jgi:hypothetical protein